MSSSATDYSSARRCKVWKNTASPGLHGFTILRQTVKETGAIEVVEGGNSSRIGLGFQVAPGRELRQQNVDLLDPRWRTGPLSFGQHLIRSQLQAVLPLGRRENVEDGPISGRFFGTDIPEKFSCVGSHRPFQTILRSRITVNPDGLHTTGAGS
jgi:hypothetical protein